MKMTGDWSRILKFKCFPPRAATYHPLHEDPYSNNFRNTPDETTSAESLDTPTADSHLVDETRLEDCNCDIENKESKLRLSTISNRRRSEVNQLPFNSQHPTSPTDENSSRNNNNNNTNSNGILHFLGFHFNKSETRHLEHRNNSQGQGSTGPITNTLGSKVASASSSRKSVQESRYTKLPLSGGSSGSTSVQSTKPKTSHTPSSCLFHIQGRKGGEKNRKHLQGKSKSDNNLHRVSGSSGGGIGHLLETSSLSTSTFRVGNDYCESRRLNSVQAGDHATISLPWKQNNLSSVTQAKNHPNTILNIESNQRSLTTGHRYSQDRDSPPERPRSKSLERTSSTRLHSSRSSHIGLNGVLNDSNCSQNQSIFSNGCSEIKTHERFTNRANSIECHPHQRVRKTLNQREQEILLRHIVPLSSELSQKGARTSQCAGAGGTKGTATNTAKKDLNLVPAVPASGSQLPSPAPHSPPEPLKTVTLKKGQVAALTGITKAGDLVSPGDRFSSSSLQHSPRSPRSPTASSPGAVSCPPSPPPRPPSTLKAFRSRLVSPIDKAKAPTPSPTPTPTKTPVSAFPFPPIMSTRTESAHIPISSQFQGTGRAGDVGGNSAEIHGGAGGGTANGICMSSVEEARNSGFINQPAKGWLHSDKLLTKEGVTYAVRYIGCHDVNTSMKSLDFETRSLIAKECINQVCEAAGFKAVDRKRKIDRRLVKILGLKPRLEHAGSDVCLTITSTCLRLTSLETGAVIAVHEMPNISFASGGDVTMLDFVAYVAKDAVVGRACFVLECGSGLAQDVITTIGQAFELRFKEYLQKRPPPLPKLANDDPEYYNDLPGKLPPENQLQLVGKISQNGQRTKPTPSTLTLDPTSDKEMAVNLIDFEAPTPPAFGQVPPEKALESLLLGEGSPLPQTDDPNVDPFDMNTLNGSLGRRKLTIEEQRKALESEPWFHGIVSRGEAEAIVVNDGDYLVRESQATPHQYVLTGLQNGSPKHLLLVDPEGVVRTKDRTFDSVSHLIHHHSQHNRPIISAESIVLLRTPILRRPTN